MTIAYDKARKEYVRQRATMANLDANKGKTSHQLVEECDGLDIDRVDRIWAAKNDTKRTR